MPFMIVMREPGIAAATWRVISGVHELVRTEPFEVEM